VKDKLVDTIAILIAALVVAIAIGGIGLVLASEMLGRPTEYRGVRVEGSIGGTSFAHVRGRTNLKHRFVKEGRSIVNYVDDSAYAPIIDLQPDGGGLEGELDRDALGRAIGE
jgi:hypothetical protein